MATFPIPPHEPCNRPSGLKRRLTDSSLVSAFFQTIPVFPSLPVIFKQADTVRLVKRSFRPGEPFVQKDRASIRETIAGDGFSRAQRVAVPLHSRLRSNTTLPATIVMTAWVSRISSAGMLMMSFDRTARSANLPGVIEPRTSSSKLT